MNRRDLFTLIIAILVLLLDSITLRYQPVVVMLFPCLVMAIFLANNLTVRGVTLLVVSSIVYGAVTQQNLGSLAVSALIAVVVVQILPEIAAVKPVTFGLFWATMLLLASLVSGQLLPGLVILQFGINLLLTLGVYTVFIRTSDNSHKHGYAI